MSRTNGFSIDSLAADLVKLTELIENDQYEDAAEFLDRARVSCERNGGETLIELFVAAQHICRMCGQSRAEMVWHLQAQERASERESELRNQLQALLEKLGGGDSGKPHLTSNGSKSGTSPKSKPAKETSENRRLWGIFQGLFSARRPAGPPSRAPEAPVRPPASASASNGAAAGDHQPRTLLTVYCLGPFRVFRGDRMISAWPSLKGKSIFKYLIKHHHTPISKDVLMDVFWPEADVENARRNLHQAIYSLRQTLKQGQPDFQAILSEKDHYQINPELELRLDFEEFERYVKNGRRLESAGKIVEAMAEYAGAEELYRGDFLEEDLYEDSVCLQRERIRAEYLDLADRLSAHYAQQGDYAAAISLCQKILGKDNCHEKAHRRLMHCYQATGQTSLAVRQYQLCVNTLKTELEVSPSAETQRLFKNITGAA
jgi:DNA-binding SARP family transcriptional activator